LPAARPLQLELVCLTHRAAPHTAVQVAAGTLEALAGIGITGQKVFSITTDGAANMLAAQRILRDDAGTNGVRCLAHLLNGIEKKAAVPLKKVPDDVRFFPICSSFLARP
jgi:hypothetical protein